MSPCPQQLGVNEFRSRSSWPLAVLVNGAFEDFRISASLSLDQHIARILSHVFLGRALRAKSCAFNRETGSIVQSRKQQG